jgi:hypothetical protein
MNIGMEFTLILRDAELAARNADPILGHELFELLRRSGA